MILPQKILLEARGLCPRVTNKLLEILKLLYPRQAWSASVANANGGGWVHGGWATKRKDIRRDYGLRRPRLKKNLELYGWFFRCWVLEVEGKGPEGMC